MEKSQDQFKEVKTMGAKDVQIAKMVAHKSAVELLKSRQDILKQGTQKTKEAVSALQQALWESLYLFLNED